MYQFTASKKVSRSETVQQKRGGQTFNPLNKNRIVNADKLLDDTLHQKLLQRFASDNYDYLRGNDSDNHAVPLKSVIQMANGRNAFNAGDPRGWHIHHGEHIKYGSLVDSRVNFAGKSRKKIRKEIGENIDRFNLSNTVTSSYFRECINWINENID